MDDNSRIELPLERGGAAADLNARESYLQYNIFGDQRQGQVLEGVDVDGGAILAILATLLAVWQFLAGILCLFLLAGVVYYRYKTWEIRRAEALWLYGPESERYDRKENENWRQVLEYLDSEEPSRWRLAIMEADLMLSELVSGMRYRGQTLTEQLDNIEQSDFTTIRQAKEAHAFKEYMVGNGLDFVITQAEARRVIELYRQIFVEFRLIYDLNPKTK